MENREYQKVIAYVKEEIKKGNLKISDKLPTERALEEKLNISRGSIREAIKIMENMGLLQSRQGSGNYLAGNVSKTMSEILHMMILLKQTDEKEVSSLRKIIEMEAYRLAIKNVINSQLEEMEKQVWNMEQGISLCDSDFEFHVCLIKASNNKLLIMLMNALESVCDEAVRNVLQRAESKQMEKMIKIHRDILEALKQRNEKGIEMIESHYKYIESLSISQM